jgi:hypothetical protein
VFQLKDTEAESKKQIKAKEGEYNHYWDYIQNF